MEGWVESAVIAVVISSLVTVAGWFVAHGSERRLEVARRQEKIQDFQTALLADIRSTVHRFQQVDLDRHLEEVLARIDSAPEGRSYTPFVPREPGSLLWSTIAQEVHIIPNEVIDPVVLFFSQLETVRHFVEDLRSERFTMLEPMRKRAMFQDYVRMMRYLVLLADDADRALSRSLRIAPPVSSSGVGPSSRSKASA